MEWLDNLNGNDMRLDRWGMCFFVATATTVEPWRAPTINWGASQLRMLQGSYRGASHNYPGGAGVLVPYEQLGVGLTRRKVLTCRPSHPFTMFESEDVYDVKAFPRQAWMRENTFELYTSGEHFMYPVLTSETSAAERELWAAHGHDVAWINARTTPAVLREMLRNDTTIVLVSLSVGEMLPVMSSEDVDPVNLSDLIGNLGGAWSVLIAVFGRIFLSTDWGTRKPVGPLTVDWWTQGTWCRARNAAMEDEGGDAEEGGGKSVIRGLSRAARKAILPSGGFSCHQRKLQLTLSDLKARICALEDEEGRVCNGCGSARPGGTVSGVGRGVQQLGAHSRRSRSGL